MQKQITIQQVSTN